MGCGDCSSGSRDRFLASIKEAAMLSVAKVIQKARDTQFDLGDRSGGYFSTRGFGYIEDPNAVPPMLVGEVTNGKDDKYIEFSLEKSGRLHEHTDDGHELSSESRDPDQGKWGGSVKAVDPHGHIWILSFSGLPEMLNEAAMLLVAVLIGGMTMAHAKELAAKSLVTENGNTFFLENQWDVADEEAEAR